MTLVIAKMAKPALVVATVAKRDHKKGAATGAGVGAAGATAGTGYLGYGIKRALLPDKSKLRDAANVARRLPRSMVGHGGPQLLAAGAATGGLAGAAIGRKSKPQVAKAHKFATKDENSGGLKYLTARTPAGKFVSHANKLSVTHVSPRRNVSSKLAVYGRSHGRKLT